MIDDLGTRLRQATWPSHQAVEKTGVIRAMIRGELSRPAYCLFLRNLQVIYESLESALLGAGTDPRIGPLILPGMFRSEALTKDLQSLHGAAWAQDLPLVDTAVRYAERLDRFARENPVPLIAHAYVRYMGDLSGGQALSRSIARSLSLGGSSGVAFYDFGGPDQVLALKEAFRGALNGLELSVKEQGVVIDESILAFELHRIMAEELAGAADQGVAVPPCRE